MRTQTSHHTESIRRRATSYFPRNNDQPTKYRPVLNIKKLVKTIKKAIRANESSQTSGSAIPSRKRYASPLSDDNNPKRRKTSSNGSDDSDVSDIEDAEMQLDENRDKDDEDEDSEDSDDCDWSPNNWERAWGKYPYAFNYPLIGAAGHVFMQEESLDGLNHVPVLVHVSELHYTKDIPDGDEKNFVDDHIAEKRGWDKEENELMDLFKELSRDAIEPISLGLGEVWLCTYKGRYVALSGEPKDVNQEYGESAQSESNKWFLCVPSIAWPNEIDFEGGDYTPSTLHEDMLETVNILGFMGRACIKSKLTLIILPASACDELSSELPFRLQVETTVSLVAPAIFEPIFGTKRELAEKEEAQRRFLSFLFPPPASEIHTPDASADIPFLYSILTPAPALNSAVAEEALQPDALLPTLLPFQRRSLGWMLEREGKLVNPNGEIVPRALVKDIRDDFPLFWYKVELEGGVVWYIHSLTGQVAPEHPKEDSPLGGILAEEPGLGKTLECISLVLINPAPERNPSISRWDEEAKITLKQIKTTLIVTPPSLASQWVDELALHAPSLKVFVYDGWSKLNVPITEYELELEREKRSNGGKVKSKGQQTANSKAKKGKGKAQDDGDYMDVSSPAVSSPKDQSSGHGTNGEDILDWCSYINTFDVCITTYATLRQDLSVARAAPVRPRRQDVVYSNVERARSPLVMCEWYRVIMDEVQMVGGGKTEEMVSLLPRISSFAVSGTPARAEVSDLRHVLKFLRVDHLIGHNRLWSRLLKSGFSDQFAAIFRRYAVRTMKSAVKDELTIPQQKRFLVGIDLGPIERHVYDQNLEEALLQLGLDARGVAASVGWEIDASLLRTLLRKLRGICTHPQVGQLQKPGDKSMKSGALKSIGDVLDTMKDQNWRNLMDDRKTKIQVITRRAQLQQHDKTDLTRYQHALETLEIAEKDCNDLIEHVKTAIAEHAEKGDILKKEVLALKESLPRRDLAEASRDEGKGKAPERELSPISDADSEDHDLPKTPAGQEHGNKRRALQQRLRESHVTLHKIKFLQGDVYHVLGASHSAEEDAAYAAADVIRRSLLKTTEEGASRAMDILQRDAAVKGLTESSLQIHLPFCGKGGIRSSDLLDEANELIEGLLNEQSSLLWKWRTRMHSLLTQSLKGEEQADGEEYGRSLEAQGEADMYLQAYTALLADRRAALVAERTLLAAHDGKDKKIRITKAATAATASAAAVKAMQHPELSEDIELQPEHEVLFKDLTNARKSLLEDYDARAIKSIVIDLNAIVMKIHSDNDPEKVIVKQEIAALRKLMNDQGTLIEKLEGDLALFRKAFNERILYFRQLQEISDSVTEATWDHDVNDAIETSVAEQHALEGKINTNRARQRFLNHLSRNKEDGTMDEDDECCILCRCEFTRGYITSCAHVFCEPCMNAWTARRDGKTCPVCRVVIHTDQLQRFTVEDKNKEASPPPLITSDEPAPKSRREIRYNRIDPKLFEEVQTIESFGSYGSKIQTLVRHLLYLQLTEPGAKSIVFSAWADSLHIIEHALKTNKIPCLRIDQSGGKKQSAAKRFRSDPDILVLLLHGERENAGLNVTCASRVFLVESVVHHGFEVQAIARIDRMGQTRPTEVFCYYAEDTIEKNILDLAARQGLSLYTENNSAGTLNVTPFALDAEKKTDSPSKKKVQKGDFIYKTDDMLAILFPHMYYYEDYIDANDVAMDLDLNGIDNNRVGQTPTNATAGPSRLA